MTIPRRGILKMFALSPLFSISSALASQSKRLVAPNVHPVNILLHGFFFMEYDDTNKRLLVGSPFYVNHNVGYIDRPAHQMQYIPYTATQPDDLTSTLAGDSSSAVYFPSDIMQFSKRETNNTGIMMIDPSVGVGDVPGKYKCLLILPYPKDIVTIRSGGSLSDFNVAGSVGASIRRHTGVPLSLITCLQYDIQGTGPGFRIRSYFAEHCDSGPDDAEMAKVLMAARNTLKGTFDLGITGIPQVACTTQPGPDTGALCELPFPTVLNNPCSQKHLKLGKKVIHTANCPQFGIGP